MERDKSKAYTVVLERGKSKEPIVVVERDNSKIYIQRTV